MLQLPSLIFIDGGDPEETKKADEVLKQHGFNGIMGQTTNPTLVAKNPDIQKYIATGKRLTTDEALVEYKKIVEAVAAVTDGPVSIQVIGDKNTSSEEFLRQARVYKDWIPNGVVKFPCISSGLAAAEVFCTEYPVNMTLNFSQSQAAAVYAATRNARHRVFISPFVGRLDDKGECGMDVVANEIKMYQSSDKHVEVLTASLRKLEHLKYALHLKSPAITLPFKVFELWEHSGFAWPVADFTYDPGTMARIQYREIPLNQDWQSYDVSHPLTDDGVVKFMEDWLSITK